jgi:dihydrodipicolinate synthase/N-acetylneuraminate lyase
MDKRYPITMMCAACVPWTEDWQFNETTFRRQVRNLVRHDVKSIYIFGTAGEGYAVNAAVFARVVEALVDECSQGSGVMPMTGIISTSMMEMLDRIKIAGDLGCRDFQVAFPCWGALSDEEVMDYFKALCFKYPDYRFIHYNNGPRSKKLCKIDLYEKLAREVPNLVAAKYSTGNMGEINNIVDADCPITFFLVDKGYTYGSMKGSCGLLNSFASVDLQLAWKYFYAGQNRDYATLLDLDSYYKELNDSFNFISRDMIDSAFDKSIERMADPEFNNTLYPPYQGLTEAEFKIVDAKMKATLKKYQAKYCLIP